MDYGINGKRVSYRVEAKVCKNWLPIDGEAVEQNLSEEPAVERSYDDGSDAMWAAVNVRPFYDDVRVIRVAEEVIALPPVQHKYDPKVALSHAWRNDSKPPLLRDYEGRN